MIYSCAFYLSKEATASHFSLAVTILTTVIIGGCVILLVENQHTQGEVLMRYHHVMRPFYHKLTLYAKFVQQCLFALCTIDKEDEAGKEYKRVINETCVDLKIIANRAVVRGKDAAYLKAAYLDSVCNNINHIWYMFDRNYDMYNHLRFDNARLIEEVRDSLLDYDRSFEDKNIDVHLLPLVSGDFYVKEWLPIDNVPFQFEQFVEKCREINLWLYASFTVEAISLLLVFASESFDGMSLVAVDAAVFVSVVMFIISLFKFLKIKSKVLRLQF